MTLQFIYILHNISIQLLTMTSQCGLFECRLQMWTLCQSQLYFSQTFFWSYVLAVQNPLLQLGWFIVIQLPFQGQTCASIALCLWHGSFLYSLFFIYFFIRKKKLFPSVLWETGLKNKKTKTELCLLRDTQQTEKNGSLSNEIHPDDVCMNIFMRDMQGKQDGHKSSQVRE